MRNAPAPDENAVQVMIGATVSSRAFLRGVNAALAVMNKIGVQPSPTEPERTYITEDEDAEEEENPDNG